jgi:hypothetical protein
VESYHAVLKKKGDASFGIIGACKVVYTADQSYFDRATRTKLDFRTKSISEAVNYPSLLGFPNPVQSLLLDEIRMFEKRLEDGKPMPNHDIPECHCQFFRKYMLPCKHLFHRDINGDFLMDDHWTGFRNMFVESGFDVYVTRIEVIEEQLVDPRLVEAEEQRLQFYAAMEEVREYWFALEAAYQQSGDPTLLNNLIMQIRGAAVHQADRVH